MQQEGGFPRQGKGAAQQLAVHLHGCAHMHACILRRCAWCTYALTGSGCAFLLGTESSILCFSCRYALTGKEVVSILMQRLVKVDGKVRTDCTYPAGFMDVIEIDRTDEHFRLIYDTKGRFVTHRITKVDYADQLLS